MIVVSPNGGLANRMRVIDSCISVIKNNRKYGNGNIQMIWQENEDLNCPFEDLFQPIEEITKVETNRMFNYSIISKRNIRLPLKSRIKRAFYIGLSGRWEYFDDKTILNHFHDTNYWNTISKNLVVDSCIDFYSPTLQHPGVFKPIKLLQDRIDEQVTGFTKPTVGIHIRRADNLKSINQSPTELFEVRIRQILDAGNDFYFYLATDDQNEEQFLRNKFGSRVLVQENKTLSRNSKTGIQSALVDLYALSNTQSIIGSYWSSFSMTAAAIKGIPVEIIQKA